MLSESKGPNAMTLSRGSVPEVHDEKSPIGLTDFWLTFGPLLLAAACVAITILVQKHLGCFLSSGASIDFLLLAGVLGFLAGQVMSAIGQAPARMPAKLIERRPVRLGVVFRRALLRSVIPIVSSMVAYGLYRSLPHYQNPAYSAFMRWVDVLLLVYVLGAIPYAAFSVLLELRTAPLRQSFASREELVVVRGMESLRQRSIRPLLRAGRHRRVKSLMLSLPLRFFFVPLMFSSVMGLRMHLLLHIAFVDDPWSSVEFLYKWLLPFVIKACLFLDVLIATIAYLVESRWLGSRIRSVDRNWTGWAACLICYYPFHVYLDDMLPGTSQPTAAWAGTPLVDHALLAATALVHVCWLLPSICLGFRASNLTNRGIVRFGPYRWIRHPQYAFQMLWLTLILVPRIHQTGAIVTTCVMIAIYVARCVTEERHLSADPAYRAYCATTRYRVLPGVW